MSQSDLEAQLEQQAMMMGQLKEMIRDREKTLQERDRELKVRLQNIERLPHTRPVLKQMQQNYWICLFCIRGALLMNFCANMASN